MALSVRNPTNLIHIFLISEKKESASKHKHRDIVTVLSPLNESTLKARPVLIAALLCWNTLDTLKLLILTICKDKKTLRLPPLSICLLLMKYQVPPYHFNGRKTRFLGECMSVCRVTEVYCSGGKQKFKYLLSNKRITPSLEYMASNRARSWFIEAFSWSALKYEAEYCVESSTGDIFWLLVHIWSKRFPKSPKIWKTIVWNGPNCCLIIT